MKKIKSVLCCLAFAMAVSSLQSAPHFEKNEIKKDKIELSGISASEAVLYNVPCGTFCVEQKSDDLYLSEGLAKVSETFIEKKEKAKTSSGWLDERLFNTDKYKLAGLPAKARYDIYSAKMHVDPGLIC